MAIPAGKGRGSGWMCGWTILLLGVGSAHAQGRPEALPTPAQLPTSAQCAAIAGPSDAALPAGFRAAVQTTLSGYAAENAALYRQFRSAQSSSPDLMRQLLAQQATEQAYLRRLLARTGWIGSGRGGPALMHALAGLIGQTDDPPVEWCAGQLAIHATSTEERQAGASMVDQALLAVTGEQRYGTALRLLGRKLTPLPIAEAAQVDARRAGIGLPTLAESLREAQQTLPPRTPPPGLARPVRLNPVCTDTSTIPEHAFSTPGALNRPLSPEELDRLDDRAAALVEQDQAARTGQPDARDMAVVDAESTAWLRRMLKDFGWPSTNRADPELAFNVWLLTQHADATPGLQACVLDLMTQQVSTLQERGNLAYLTDRVRTGRGEMQIYGTQVTYDDVQGQATVRPVIDPAHLNARRAAVGLEPIEEYLKSFARPRP